MIPLLNEQILCFIKFQSNNNEWNITPKLILNAICINRCSLCTLLTAYDNAVPEYQFVKLRHREAFSCSTYLGSALSVYPTKTSPHTCWALGCSAVTGLSGRGRKTSRTSLKVRFHSKALWRSNNAAIKREKNDVILYIRALLLEFNEGNLKFLKSKTKERTKTSHLQ